MIPTEWLAHQARARPEALALRDAEGASLTYGDLARRAAPVAAQLIGRQAPCVVELEPGLEHAIAINAAIVARTPFQTLRPGLPAAEREAALAGWEHAERFEAAWLEERLGDDRSLTLFGRDAGTRQTLCRILTSGTSGVRKPVELSWGNHFSSAAASAFNLGVRTDDRWLCCMPVDHIGGLSVLIRSLIYGTAAVIHPGFDAGRVADELRGDVTVVSLVATQLRRLLDAGAAIDRPRLILLGGGPVPDDLLDEALAAGASVVQTYGMTEACSQICTLAVADASRGRGSAGRPLPGTEVEIEAGGEILVRGPTVAAGSVAADGWLHTGDRGRFDDAGFLRVDGRLDDLIVSGGENVAPEEVEAALLTHPAVAETAVVGRPDREWGSAVVAVVVAVAGEDPEASELIEHCRASLAPHKLPKTIELVDELPRSPAGKLLRRELR